MMGLTERPTRKAKRTDVDYAVLSSGQQIPEYSTEEENPSDSEDESYGVKNKKRKKTGGNKSSGECFICQKPSRSIMLQCDSCSRLYHAACGRPYQSASILGNTSCYECLQEAKVDSMSSLPRKTLETIDDFLAVLKKAKKIVVIAGAGISVSCGIPDFRSKDGIYAMARNMDVVLPEPECLFQIEYFREDPAPFFEVVRNAFAHSPLPSPTHRFLRLLQDKKKLLRVYTQNIDGLEEAAGVTKCIPCHGSFAWSACMRCKKRVPTSELMPVIQAGVIPTCSGPNCRGVLKPEITFFGEILADNVSTTITKDRLQADLLLVIGTSLKVAPVMEIPGYLPAHIPQVVINKTALKKKKLKAKQLSAAGKLSRTSNNKIGQDTPGDEEEFDLSLLGECDDIVQYICDEAGWILDAKTSKNCKNKLARGMNEDYDDDEDEEEEEELGDDIVCNRCEVRIDTDGEPGPECKTVHFRCE
ncbi:hypothetical protein PHYBOEH_004861 [Phytophthora boehmeriae]|uniref:Deacetylase sirtuin-type domain-containing protein n=1 Tax=Phytophthora boehmeriae TaxID=109152 RepID=A0A8T1WRY8_9STRA|nr:hypothetical protein PHYBOEH_004861 [Phytophthora boehmeriae]